MKVIRFNSSKDILIDENISLTIGAFDGIHLGHQALIKELQKSKLKKALLTFDPTPKAFFSNNYTYITPINKKISILDGLIDFILIINFNKHFSEVSKEDFIEFLKNNHVKEVICGTDFTFGAAKSGKAFDLNCFKLKIVEPVFLDNIRVSSTLVKNLLKQGCVKEAKKYLSRHYSISGHVIHGSALGRTIGFPTANINSADFIVPKNGVYYTNTLYKGHLYRSMTNIGNNPTINLQENIRIETYILDINEYFYDEKIEIFFIDRIRDEKKFNSKDELIDELKRNVKEVREYNEE